MKIKKSKFKFRICCYKAAGAEFISKHRHRPISNNAKSSLPLHRPIVGCQGRNGKELQLKTVIFFFTFAFFFSTRTAIKLRLKSLIVFQMLRKLQIVKPQKQVLSWQWLHTWEEAFPSSKCGKFSQIYSCTISSPALPLSH